MLDKSLNASTMQLIERKLGMFASSYLGNDFYYLIEAINLLISAIGKESVEKELKKDGKNLAEFEEKLKELNLLSNYTKVFYDSIQDKKFEKKSVSDVEETLRNYLRKSASRIAIIQRDVFDLLIFLIESTSIRNRSISSDAFKILEHQGTGKFDMTNRTSSGGS